MSRESRQPATPVDFERWLIDAGRRERVPIGAIERAHRAVSDRASCALFSLPGGWATLLGSLAVACAASLVLAPRADADTHASFERIGSGGGALTAPGDRRVDDGRVDLSRSNATTTAGAGRFLNTARPASRTLTPGPSPRAPRAGEGS